MRMWCALVSLWAGCGRVGFTPTTDADELGAFSAPTPIDELNSPSEDDDPSLTGDMLEVYFQSARSGMQALYRATRTSPTAVWSTPEPVAEINSGGDNNNAKVTPDGLGLYFASKRAPNAGGTDLWFSTRPDRASAWSPPQPIPELATTRDDLEPWIAGVDHRTIYFSRTVSSQVDIYVATRPAPDQPFGAATKVAELSTAQYDGGIWVDATERMALLHSAITGSTDLYISIRASTADPWPAPSPYDLFNSPVDDQDPWLSPDEHTFVFSSERTGNFDLYVSTR